MDELTKKNQEQLLHEKEIIPKYRSGLGMLFLLILLMILSIGISILGFMYEVNGAATGVSIAIGIAGLVAFVVFMIMLAGLKVLKPNEALVLTLFGRYYGTLKGAGFFYVNPFVTSVNPAKEVPRERATTESEIKINGKETSVNVNISSKKISLKALTLNNEKQKINDQLGNPIIIGIVIIWKVSNTAKAVFNVDNYVEFLSIQCDSALRDIVRLYPYDAGNSDDNEKTLRGSSQEIAENLKTEIQRKVEIAGLEITEARITHLAYAPEIAAVMLQRQQASAIIDARQMIVEGAVGMVEMALEKLNQNDIVHLDEERKAAMVSNLLVVLCGNKDAQPIVNSGSLY